MTLNKSKHFPTLCESRKLHLYWKSLQKRSVLKMDNVLVHVKSGKNQRYANSGEDQRIATNQNFVRSANL
jgi:hypothetical protein